MALEALALLAAVGLISALWGVRRTLLLRERAEISRWADLDDRITGLLPEPGMPGAADAAPGGLAVTECRRSDTRKREAGSWTIR